VDGFGDSLDDGSEVWLERIENGFLNDVHDEFCGCRGERAGVGDVDIPRKGKVGLSTLFSYSF
jgi:hypothetical protein